MPHTKPKQANVRLTDLERAALELAAEGMTSHQIGEKLCYSKGWVEEQLLRVHKKLGVNRRIQAVTRALELGIIGGQR